MGAASAGLPLGTLIEVWFQDEMRVGQKGTLTRIWAETGSRPTAPRSDGYRSVYLFGAVCPGRDLGCALILPRCDTAAMGLFLAELGGHVAPGAHGIVVLDGAGWHTARGLRWPDNLTPLPLPASSPELNPQERAWEFLRQHYLALRRFLDRTALLDACQGRLAPVHRPAGAYSIPLLLSLGHRPIISRKPYKTSPGHESGLMVGDERMKNIWFIDLDEPLGGALW